MSEDRKAYMGSESSTGQAGEIDDPARQPEPPPISTAPLPGAASFVESQLQAEATEAATAFPRPAFAPGTLAGNGELLPRPEAVAPRPAPGESGGGPCKLSHRHRAIMDFMLANPGMQLGTIADALGYTRSWVSQVIHNDLFRMELAQRRATFEHEQHAKLTQRLLQVADSGLEHMQGMLKRSDPDELTPAVVNTFTELAMKSLGYIGKQGSTVNVNAPMQVNKTMVVQKDDLIEAQAIINKLHGVAA